MTETLLYIAYGLSCGVLAFHLYEVILGANEYWPGAGFFLLCAVVSSLLKSSYESYESQDHTTSRRHNE